MKNKVFVKFLKVQILQSIVVVAMFIANITLKSNCQIFLYEPELPKELK